MHARAAKQSGELADAVAAARERESVAQQQLKAAEAKLREAVQRDERWGACWDAAVEWLGAAITCCRC